MRKDAARVQREAKIRKDLTCNLPQPQRARAGRASPRLLSLGKWLVLVGRGGLVLVGRGELGREGGGEASRCAKGAQGLVAAFFSRWLNGADCERERERESAELYFQKE